jgi:hypothetical protein
LIFQIDIFIRNFLLLNLEKFRKKFEILAKTVKKIIGFKLNFKLNNFYLGSPLGHFAYHERNN